MIDGMSSGKKRKKHRKGTLFRRMLLFIGAASLVPLAVIIAVASLRSYSTVSEETMRYANEQGRTAAALIKADLQLHLGAVRSLAAAFESFRKVPPRKRREFFSEEIRATLVRYPSALAVWTQWAPGAIGDDPSAYAGTALSAPNSGFGAVWYRKNGRLHTMNLQDCDYDAVYYTAVKARGRETIVDPYPYSYTREPEDTVMMVSICAPIFADGNFLGITGIDLPLDFYQSVTSGIKILESGYGILIANNGMIMAHPMRERIGITIGDDVPACERGRELEHIRTGRLFSIVKNAKLTGELSRQLFFPIPVGNTGTPWSLAVVVPLDELSRSAMRLAVTLALLGAGGALIIFAAIYLTARNMTRPITSLSEATRRISAGDLGGRVAITGTGELADLSSSFNTMAEKLGTTMGQYDEANRKLERKNRSLRKAQEELRRLNTGLEDMVASRTAELDRTVEELSSANDELERSLDSLQSAQNHIIAAEKMAVLGQLIAGIAHEINTPLGAIKSSASMISEMEKEMCESIPSFILTLDDDDRELFFALVRSGRANRRHVPDAASRKKRRALAARLEAEGVPSAESAADDIETVMGFSFTDRIIDAIRRGKEDILFIAARYATVSRAVFIITDASDKAARTVSALVDYSRQDDYDTSGIVAPIKEIETILILYYSSTKHGILIERDYESSSPVTGSRDRLNQVWINLINNAIQAMNGRGTLRIGVHRDGDRVNVSFSDSGPGIPETIRSRIFQPFFTTKQRGEGTGLGLDICRKIIDRHGGTISFESVPGETTFTVSLKAAEVQGEAR